MTAKIMDGVRLGDEIVAGIRDEIVAAGGRPICLATVVVADDAASHSHVRTKQRQAIAAGMRWRGVALPSSATQSAVDDAVAALAADPEVHGVFVQLPLPPAIDLDRVLALVPPDKDIDGMTEVSLARLAAGLPGHVPATPLAVLRLLERYDVPTMGRHAVIVGNAPYVSAPLAVMLARPEIGATVIRADVGDADLATACAQADIVIATANSARLIDASHVGAGATVVDAGTTRTDDGIVGDVDLDAVANVAGAVVPMPGGIGPVTVACLLANTLSAARQQGAMI